MNLALKYRPKTFDDMVGQKGVCILLQAMIQKNMLDSALLFTGPSGVGKTSMARIIAAQLNSEGATDVHEGTHPSVLEIDAASSGSVAALRQLKSDLNFTTWGHRVVILDEAHAISDEGKIVLLNMLEFVPENVTFILLTTESHRIPKEVRHRCDEYKFKAASVEDLVKMLEKVVEIEGISADFNLLNLISQRSQGSYREALMLLKQIWAAQVTSVEEYNSVFGEHDFGPFLLNEALKGPVSAPSALENTLFHMPASEIISSLIITLKDLMILKSNQPIDFTGSSLEIRQDLARSLTPALILKALRIMWDLETKLQNSDKNLSLHMAYLLIAEAIGKTATDTLSQLSVQANITQNTTPMSFAAMQQRLGS